MWQGIRQTATPNGRTIRLDVTWLALLRIVAVGVGLWLLIQVWEIILVLVVALVLAGTLSPIIDWLERRSIKRSVGLGAIVLALVLAVVGIGFLVIPALFGQLNQALTNAPVVQQAVADAMEPFPSLTRWRTMIREANPDDYLAPFTNYALGYAQTAVEIVAYGVTTVILALYILADRERVTGFLYALVPRRFHLRLARIMLDMETIVGGYMRGQALTSLAMGLFAYVLLTVLGAPNALAIAIFAAFADLIPFIGTLLATIPIVVAALTVGPLAALIALVASIIYDQFEGRLLVPRVYEATMRLSPVAVMLALLVGGTLLGVVGALLALPIAAGIRVVIEDMRIELPGEQPGEAVERTIHEEAEEVFAERAEGSSAVEAAAIATELAEQLQEEINQLDQPVEERADAGADQSLHGAGAEAATLNPIAASPPSPLARDATRH